MALGRKRVNEAYAGQAYLQSVTTVEALQSALDQNGWDGDKRNISKWFDGSRPHAENAWAIGEALRACDLQGASGFASMWTFDYPGEAAAILGMCDKENVLAHGGGLIAMVASAPLLSYRSPYDVLPRDHRILNGDADDWNLRQLADAEIVRAISKDYRAEADLLNSRFLCRRVWQINEELLSVLNAGAYRWFASKGGEAPTLPDGLRAAYYIGAAPPASVPHAERHFAVQNLLVSWLAQIRQPTVEESLAFGANAATPNTPESMAFRSIVQCSTHIAEAIHGVQLEISELTLVRLIAAYIESQVGESFGFTNDVIARAARDSQFEQL